MKRVLYLEENMDTARALQVMLKNAGYEVEIASDKYECMEMVKKSKFDLVLIDLQPPEMYGYDLFESLNKQKKCFFAFHSYIPLSPGVCNLFKKVGVSDHLVKPYNKVDLLIRLENIFR